MRLERSDLELEVLVRRIESDEIDLQPDFQRGEVWNDERQRRLIDTVLRGWYVPAIHVINDPETSRDLVLDGQQRLAAIRLFFADQLTVAGDLSPADTSLRALHGLRYSELPDEAQRRVRRFPLTVVTLSNYEPEEPYELFFRLNQHMTLTPPEKRNALYGRARDQVKEVVERLIDRQLLRREIVGFANTRLAYDDVFARFMLTLQSGTLRESYSNRAIETFYREEEFSSAVLDQSTLAGEHFLACAKEASPKLNKATLLSWLIFTHSLFATRRPLKADFILFFEHHRRLIKTAPREVEPALSTVVRTFNDRASYRVNDTLSILLRDLALHAAHALSTRAEGTRQLKPLLANLGKQESDGEAELLRFLESTRWDLPR